MRVTVSIGRTVNLGNYESARFDFGIEDEVPKGVSADDHAAALLKRADLWLETACTPIEDALAGEKNKERR